MSISAVDRVQQRAQVHQQLEAFQVQQRLSLFSANTFERTSAVKMGDGTQLAIPQMSGSDQSALMAMFNSVPPAGRAELEQLTTNFGEAIYNELHTNPNCVTTGQFSSGLTEMVSTVTTTSSGLTGAREDDKAVQGMLLVGLVGIEQDVGNFARVVEGKVQLASELRTDATELRNAAQDWPDGVDKQYFEWTEVSWDADGNMKVEHKSGELTKEEAIAKADDIEGMRTQLGDITEMDKFELQQMTNDYQQAMNILTAMLKNMHDTQKAIIQNTKA